MYIRVSTIIHNAADAEGSVSSLLVQCWLCWFNFGPVLVEGRFSFGYSMV